MSTPPLTQLSPPERWPALDDRLADIERAAGFATPPDTGLTHLDDLAASVGVTEETLIRQLRKGGARPFRLGKRMVIRDRELADYYERKEAGDA